MGFNMQCQAIPLLESKKCIVRTSLKSQATLDFRSVAITKQSKKIHYTDNGKISLLMNNNKRVDTNWIIYQHSNNSTYVHQ
jgi:DNA-directed RNA polymerase beta subunit